VAYIDWWNRTGPVTLGERFGLNEISTARNTLSPTKSYTEGGSARKNLEKGTSWTDFLNPGELLIRQPSEEEKIEFKEDLTKGVEFAKEKWKALWPELVKDFTPIQGEIRAKGYFDENLQELAQAQKEKKYIEMAGHGVEGVLLGAATYPWWMGVPLGARLVSKFLRLGKKPVTKVDFEKILGKGEKYQGSNIDKFTGTKNELKEIAETYIVEHAGSSKSKAASQLGYKIYRDPKTNLINNTAFADALRKIGITEVGPYSGGKALKITKFNKTQLDTPLDKSIDRLKPEELNNFLNQSIKYKRFNDVNFWKALNKLTASFKGNQQKALRHLGMDNQYKINNIQRMLQEESGARGFPVTTISWGSRFTIGDATHSNVFKLTDDISKNPNLLNDRIKKLIKDKKISKDEFYSLNEINDIIGVPTDIKGATGAMMTQLKSENVRAWPTNIKVKSIAGAKTGTSLYRLDGVLKNIERYSKRKSETGLYGQGDFGSPNRRRLEKFIDKDLAFLINKLNYSRGRMYEWGDPAATRLIRSGQGQGINPDWGHAFPIKYIDDFEFIKNSKLNRNKMYPLNSLTLQDTRINHDILMKEFGGAEKKLMGEVDEFFRAHKNWDSAAIKKAKGLNIDLKALYNKKFNAVNKFVKSKIKKEPYLEGQQNTLFGLKVDIKPGQTITIDDIKIDKTHFKPNKATSVGYIQSLDPTAVKVKDLSPKNKALWKNAIVDQYMEYVEKGMKKAFPKDVQKSMIEDFKDSFQFGYEGSISQRGGAVGEKGELRFAHGGRTGFDAGTLVAEDVISPSSETSLSKAKEVKKTGWQKTKNILSKNLGAAFSPSGLALLLAWHAKGRDAKEVATDPWTYSYAPFLGVGAEGVEFITKNIKTPAIKSFVQKALSLGVFTPAQIIKASRITTPAGWLAIIGTTLAKMPEDKKSVFLKEMNLGPEFGEKLKEEKEEYYTEGEHYAEGGIASLIK